MSYSNEDVIQYIEEEDVKFIRLTFCDLNGVQKNISIMPNMLAKTFESGVAIDASSVAGFEGYDKIVLHPDPNTISVLAWRPSQGRVIRMFCNITDESGNKVATSARDFLQGVLAKNPEVASNIKFKTDFEFYLFKLDEEGFETALPYDVAGYMDIAPLDKGENIRREVCLYLNAMDIETAGSHHSYGPAQNRIILSEVEPLTAAENAITLEAVVKNVASKNGLSANFKHQPLEDAPVSKNNITLKVAPEYLDKYYENLKAHLDEVYLFLNNTTYLYADYDAAKNVTVDKISSEIRIGRISSTANFYLVVASIIAAIASEEKPVGEEARNLAVAKAITAKSPLVNSVFPTEIVEKFTK